MNEIENSVSSQAYVIRANIEASLSGGLIAHNNKVAQMPFDSLNKHLEIELPYQFKKDNIKDAPVEDMAYWKAVLIEKQKLLDESNHGR